MVSTLQWCKSNTCSVKIVVGIFNLVLLPGWRYSVWYPGVMLGGSSEPQLTEGLLRHNPMVSQIASWFNKIPLYLHGVCIQTLITILKLDWKGSEYLFSLRKRIHMDEENAWPAMCVFSLYQSRASKVEEVMQEEGRGKDSIQCVETGLSMWLYIWLYLYCLWAACMIDWLYYNLEILAQMMI